MIRRSGGGELNRQGGRESTVYCLMTLFEKKRRSILRVSRLSFPYLRSVRPHLGVEVAGSRRPVLCPVLSMRVPAYEYGGWLYFRHFQAVNWPPLSICPFAPTCHRVRSCVGKGPTTGTKGVLGEGCVSKAAHPRSLTSYTAYAASPGLQEGFPLGSYPEQCLLSAARIIQLLSRCTRESGHLQVKHLQRFAYSFLPERGVY